jgi:hypothetical protein
MSEPEQHLCQDVCDPKNGERRSAIFGLADEAPQPDQDRHHPEAQQNLFVDTAVEGG